MGVFDHLPTACGLTTCDTATLETWATTGEVDEYNEPILAPVETELKLMGPVGAHQAKADRNTSDRNQSVEAWTFYVIPPASIALPARILYSGECFDVRTVRPLASQCCGRQKLHHYEIEAERVAG